MGSPRAPKGASTKVRFVEPLTIRWEEGQLAEIQKAADIARVPRERFIRNAVMDAVKATIETAGQR